MKTLKAPVPLTRLSSSKKERFRKISEMTDSCISIEKGDEGSAFQYWVNAKSKILCDEINIPIDANIMVSALKRCGMHVNIDSAEVDIDQEEVFLLFKCM